MCGATETTRSFFRKGQSRCCVLHPERHGEAHDGCYASQKSDNRHPGPNKHCQRRCVPRRLHPPEEKHELRRRPANIRSRSAERRECPRDTLCCSIVVCHLGLRLGDRNERFRRFPQSVRQQFGGHCTPPVRVGMFCLFPRVA